MAPEHDVVGHDIAGRGEVHAADVGSGRVGRSKTLTLDERAALAARAYIRHQYTDYEHHLASADIAELGLNDEIDIGNHHEIKRDAHRAVDEFLAHRRTRSA